MNQPARKVRNRQIASVLDTIRQDSSAADGATQLLLQLEYRRLVLKRLRLPRVQDVGFKIRSQTDEDGILLYLFSVLGVHSKSCVEICAGNGRECNTANLILNHGWHALLVDGNKDLVARGIRFFRASKQQDMVAPRYVCAWVTRANINDLLASNGFAGEIDLLSIDLDGVDYWIWNAIEVVSPRVVVVEYQDILGPERSWTIPYADDFDALSHPTTLGLPNFCGASLSAFVKLARRKGYRLVGVNESGYNAFFVRSGIADRLVPEVGVKHFFAHPKVVWGMRERFPTVKDHPWMKV